MQDLISFVEKKNVYTSNKSDNYQYIFDEFIINIFFPWVCLILLINNKNWKRSVNIILIGHWLLRSIGSSICYILEFRKHEPNANWPYSKTNWYIAVSIPSLFWLSGEILGDWYPLLRTKVVTNNSRKMRIVYFTCIMYNITKLIGIFHQFIPPDLRITDENGIRIRDFEKSKIKWWIIVISSQITSCAYDLSVIASLKNCLFNKLEELKNNSNSQKNSFLDKFKQISEFRIILSMIISIIFLPFVTAFVVIQINNYQKETPNPKIIILYSSIEQFRQVILSFNFTFMYIDQILLRRYAINNNNNNDNNNNYNNNNNNKSSENNISTNLLSNPNNNFNYKNNIYNNIYNTSDNNSNYVLINYSNNDEDSFLYNSSMKSSDKFIDTYHSCNVDSQLLSSSNNSNYLVSNIKPFDYTNNYQTNNSINDNYSLSKYY